jgi:S-adenosylmethionine/arginine decarboxylase-like enzyme
VDELLTPKPFGYSYLVDLYDCEKGACDNLEMHYRLLEKLVQDLGMHPMTPPIVLHGPTQIVNGRREEIYPDKFGVSGWQGLIESGIQCHSIEYNHFSTWDIYTCGQLDPNIVKNLLQKNFNPQHIEDHFIIRGTKYSA